MPLLRFASCWSGSVGTWDLRESFEGTEEAIQPMLLFCKHQPTPVNSRWTPNQQLPEVKKFPQGSNSRRAVAYTALSGIPPGPPGDVQPANPASCNSQFLLCDHNVQLISRVFRSTGLGFAAYR